MNESLSERQMVISSLILDIAWEIDEFTEIRKTHSPVFNEPQNECLPERDDFDCDGCIMTSRL